MARFTARATVTLIFCSLLLLAGCSKKPSNSAHPEIPLSALKLPPDLASKPGNTFAGVFTDKVVQIEPRAFLETIQSISSDRTAFVFDQADRTASKLKQGSILFVPGIAMRKVAATAVQDGHLVVITEDASLLEALKEAKIHWSVPVNFTEVPQVHRAFAPRSSNVFGWLDLIEPTAQAASNLSLSGEDDGWKYTVAATPEPGKLSFQMDVSRSYSGLVAKINGSGYVNNFENVTDIAIKDGQLESMDYQNKGLTGLVNFSWEAAKDEPGVEAAEQRVKLPSSFSVPMPIGGIPFSLEVSEALLIHPAFTGGKEVARGRFHVQYNGSQGFTIRGGSMNTDGDGSAEGSIVDNFSLAPAAPVGFVVAAAMPRTELKLGTDSVIDNIKEYVPPSLADGLLNALKNTAVGKWINNKVSDKLKTTGAAYAQVVISTSTTGAGALALVPCQRAQLVITISVGANATVLGKEKGHIDKEIFRQEKNVVVPPIKACEV